MYEAEIDNTMESIETLLLGIEIGFDSVGERDGVLSLEFRRGQEVLDGGIVAIRADLRATLDPAR